MTLGPQSPARITDSVIDRVVDAMESVNSQVRERQGTKDPPAFEAVDGIVLTAGELRRPASSPFYGFTGFELALCMSTALTATDAGAGSSAS